MFRSSFAMQCSWCLHYVTNTNVRRVNRAIICLERSRTQGKADTINLEQLITFLNEKQRDPTLNEILYPLYDEKRALEIINDYEQNEVARSESKSLINKSCGIFRVPRNVSWTCDLSRDQEVPLRGYLAMHESVSKMPPKMRTLTERERQSLWLVQSMEP